MATIPLLLSSTFLALAWAVYGRRTLAAARQVRLLREVLDEERRAAHQRKEPKQPPALSVVVTARDEARTIADTVRSFLAQRHPDLEVIAVDDRSTDGTGEILDSLAAAGTPHGGVDSDEGGGAAGGEATVRGGRLHVEHVRRLPAGWLGKCHACHAGARRARGEWILFSDGDVRLAEPDLLARLLRFVERQGLDHVAVFPDTRPMSALQSGLMSVFGQLFLLAAGAHEMDRDQQRGGAGVGAFNLMRRSAYERVGGHAPLRMDPADDVKLGRLLKESGARQRIYNGLNLVFCRWQEGTLNVIRGLEKNFFAGCGYSLLGLLALTLIALCANFGPAALAVAAVASAGPAGTTLAGAGPAAAGGAGAAAWAAVGWIAAFLPLALQIWLLAVGYLRDGRRAGMSPWIGLLHPLSILLLLGAAWNSAVVTLAQGGVRWRDTFYPLAELRRGLVRAGQGRAAQGRAGKGGSGQGREVDGAATIPALALAAALGAGLALASGGCAPAGNGAAGGGDSSAGADFPNIRLERDVEVPMRDGVILRADLYRPAPDGRYPTLVYRTPYGKHPLPEGEPTITRAARSGYAVLVQDVRGRHRSDGEFRPYQQEGKDGYDTIEWAAAQPWSNGRVGTFGLSYPGAVQWLAAMEAPPHLVAIFPAMTFATGRHFFYAGGMWDHSWIKWVAAYIAPDERRRRNLPGAKSYDESEAEWEAHKWEWQRFTPLKDFPLLKDLAPWYYEWMEHPDDGAYWDFADVVKAHPRIKAPAFNFTGWYDNNYGPTGALANFTGMRERAATSEARGGQRLMVGPWGHGDPSETRTTLGELDFGMSATLDYYGLVLRWHDRWLKGIRNGIDEGPPVRIFVMGENSWRDENEWPLARTRYTDWFLRGGGKANGAAGDGRLATEPPAGDEPADRYVHDPANPVTLENWEKWGPFDRMQALKRPDVLVYTSEPLAQDTEVTGPIKVELWITSSAPDTDFLVMLHDVHPDGRSFNLLPLEAGALRARYRNSESAPEMLEPGEPARIVIGNMATSNLFRAGHRIRLEVASSRFPALDVNPNTGEPFGTSKKGVPARQAVLHDAAHPSKVTLPVIPR
jgi:hypothetical protein